MDDGDGVKNDGAKKWKDCANWEDVADGRDMLQCGLVAARTCLAFVAFILFGILSAGMHGAPYFQSQDWDEFQCRAVYIKPPVEFQWSVGGGELASVGISASASGVDVSASASGVNGSTDGWNCTLKNGKQFCGKFGCQKPAKVCCADCNEDEEYSWFDNISVLDLPRYCREGGSGDQEGTFRIGPDKINGAWFMLPILLWFTLRIAGAIVEFIGIWNAKRESGIISALTFFGCSIVPGICLRQINLMVAAQSEPGVMFVPADNDQRAIVNGITGFVCGMFVSFQFFLHCGLLDCINECFLPCLTSRNKIREPKADEPSVGMQLLAFFCPLIPCLWKYQSEELAKTKELRGCVPKFFAVVNAVPVAVLALVEFIWMAQYTTLLPVLFQLLDRVSPSLSFNATLVVAKVFAFGLTLLDWGSGALMLYRKCKEPLLIVSASNDENSA